MAGHDGARALGRLLDGGWGYHDKDGERLARELEEAAAGERIAPQRLASFVHLVVHTIGGHLGDWPRALALGKRVLDGQMPHFETAKAWGRLSVAAVLAGDALEAADLELTYLKAAGNERGAALLDMRFMLAEALIGAKQAGEAARLYRRALDLVGQVRPSAPLDQTIAVASNNLGWELYEMPSRTPEENGLMQLAAATSLTFWRKCGNWLNAERAHYLNAVVANATGDPRAALAHADTALAVIAANGERPLDAARLHLARAAALTALDDAAGSAHAIGDADDAAAKLAAPDLRAEFAAERAKVVARR